MFMDFFCYFCGMILSILIPTYNYDCSLLVAALHKQAVESGQPFEIVVADDGSTSATVAEALKAIPKLAGCRLVTLQENQGRARVRNLLVATSTGDYLLFVDSDAQVYDPKFLERYLALAQRRCVLCGGIVHSDTLPSPDVSLRYRYEKQCEKRFTAECRNRHPYAQLRSFNLFMPRTIAERFPFNERITGYGYEDTLMGRDMARAHVQVLHIDNPLLNTDLETNPRFLAKTEEALHTLAMLNREMEGYSSLLHLHQRLCRMGMSGCMRLAYRLWGTLLRRHLTGHHPSVTLFQCYKLLYLNAILEPRGQKKA